MRRQSRTNLYLHCLQIMLRNLIIVLLYFYLIDSKMTEILSDRQRIELTIPAYLMFGISSVPGVFAPNDPSLAERAEADISKLRKKLHDVSLEPFADLTPKKRNALLRRLERVAKGEFVYWKDENALIIMIKLVLFLEILVGQQMLILWEGTPMDWAVRQLSLMSRHGFDDPQIIAAGHVQADQMLARFQKEGLYPKALNVLR